ncbi:MAG: 6-phosphogluconolactonase [Pseudomonadota bacterium]
MATNPQLTTFSDHESLAAAVVDQVEKTLTIALEKRERASLAVSGGSSPRLAHGLLAQRPLAWDRIDVTLVDERWVAPDANGSNEAFAKETLLTGKAADARFIGLWSDAENLQAGADAAARALGTIAMPFDAVLLGLGSDGHTASWFPHAEGLTEALADDAPTVAAVQAMQSEVTGTLTERLTLTLPVVASARMVGLLMTGAAKRAVFEKALQEGDIEDLPVRAILHKRPDIWVGWAP